MKTSIKHQVHHKEDEVADKQEEKDEGDEDMFTVLSQDRTAPHMSRRTKVLEVDVAKLEEENWEENTDEQQHPRHSSQHGRLVQLLVQVQR